TGVSGSGKSSLVFDSIYSLAQSSFYETLSTYVVKNLPKINKPNVYKIDNLSPCVLIEQSKLGQNPRSTVGTYTEIYTYLRLLYSRIGYPIYDSSYFSFNTPKGACLKCNGLGVELSVDLDKLIDFNKSLNEGAIKHRTWKVGSRYYNIQKAINYFDMDKKLKDYTDDELDYLLYQEPINYMNKSSGFVQNFSYEGIVSRLLKRQGDSRGLVINDYDKTFFKEISCSECHGSRLNKRALEVLVNGESLIKLLNMELEDLYEFIDKIDDEVAKEIKDKILRDLKVLIDLGLGYLTLNRGINTLSNGESQKLKLARCIDNSLNELIYVMDEPTQGFHYRDVNKIIKVVKDIVSKGNTAIVVEHNRKFIEESDNVIDIGPLSGTNGGELLYNGSYNGLLNVSESVTAKYLKNRKKINKEHKELKDYYEVSNININNIKDENIRIPKNLLTCITGVSGSGKSSLIRYLLKNDKEIIKVGRDTVGISSRSNVATYTKVFDSIRNLFADANNISAGEFSFNSSGACPKCGGTGYLKMDMHFLGDIKQECDECHGKRYRKEVLEYKYNNKNINDILEMTVSDAIGFFYDKKDIIDKLKIMEDVGLGYLKLGQSLDTLSGGEIGRVNMSSYLYKKGNMYVFDEPTVGLHLKDIEELIKVMRRMINEGNTIVVIEHNLDFILGADYIIDMGPDAGKNGGKIIFSGYIDEILNYDTYTAKAIIDYLMEE
ncbi:MAG TPA: daunorubicin resistance protein DrrC, partial [Firmicutes bacterium]|nr:daunorubicin resistance protein DrrC [Bacillota bacterium]